MRRAKELSGCVTRRAPTLHIFIIDIGNLNVRPHQTTFPLLLFSFSFSCVRRRGVPALRFHSLTFISRLFLVCCLSKHSLTLGKKKGEKGRNGNCFPLLIRLSIFFLFFPLTCLLLLASPVFKNVANLFPFSSFFRILQFSILPRILANRHLCSRCLLFVFYFACFRPPFCKDRNNDGKEGREVLCLRIFTGTQALRNFLNRALLLSLVCSLFVSLFWILERCHVTLFGS